MWEDPRCSKGQRERLSVVVQHFDQLMLVVVAMALQFPIPTGMSSGIIVGQSIGGLSKKGMKTYLECHLRS